MAYVDIPPLDGDIPYVSPYQPTIDISDANDEIWFDIINRTITPKNPENIKDALVQNDANSRNFGFMIQRYFENEDLSTKKIRVHYINSLNMHDIGDTHSIEIVGDNQGVLSFRWLITDKVCIEAGTLKFAVEFYDDNGYEWYSKTTTINITEGIYTVGEIPEPDDWYVTFKKELANMQQQIEEIKESGVATGTVNAISIPDYWQTHLDTRVDNIREVMEQAGRNKSAFLFYSDAHWDNGSKVCPQLLNYLTANTAINKTVYGGDIVSTEPTADTINDRSIMKYLWDWRSQIRNLKHYSVVGNHDDGNATNNIFSYDYVYSFLFAPEENNNIVRGADTYYYFDENREQTRYLCLDTAYEGLSTLSTAQTEFIKEVLKSTPENWHIVVVSHIWYMPDYNQYDVRPIPLTGLSTTATTLCEILDNYNSRADEFADCKAKIEFCIGGHIHYDYVGKTTGGIPIILCECAGMGYRGSFSATVGTVTETAVSGIVADYDNNKLSVIRVGRGNSFEVDLSTGSSTDIPESGEPNEPTYTNVLDEVGYMEGYRLSGGDGGEKTNTDTDVTGFIPITSSCTIYLKNVTMPDTNENYYAFVSRYDANKAHLGGYYIYSGLTNVAEYNLNYDENGNLTQFTFRHNDASYIRICVQNIDDTSIITVNEPIE